jgi:6-phosphogluconolactonase (cycloisomerase 2 family)
LDVFSGLRWFGRRACAACALAGVALFALGAGSALAASAGVVRSYASIRSDWGRLPGNQEVFVQTNNPAGNAIVVYDRADNGTLTQSGVYPTGGLGGALDGAGADHLTSQGSVVFDRWSRLLYVVNAGSNNVSVFAADGSRLDLVQVISSGGTFPVSIALRRNLAYVLNARDGGSVQGYVRFGPWMVAIPQWRRALNLSQSFQGTPTEFLNTPGEVTFTPDGSHLLVSTKANGDDVDVFGVGPDGELSAAPVVNIEGETPFAMAFDNAGRLLVTEVGTSTIASLEVQPDGQLTPVSTTLTGQAASCWILNAGDDVFYVSNAGSASETTIGDDDGVVTNLGHTPTDPGTIDATVTPDGRFLYVETGTDGIVDEFAVSPTGALTEIGSVVIPAPQGSEGLAAS